jgi:type II secretory ATPase GspE/PulE/Tfp pilus assembly ATPase PilB-like protein
MPDLLLVSVEYGGYISIIKLIIFLVLFFPWLPLLGWVHSDAKAVETKVVFWTGIVLGAGAAGAIIWLIMPIFVIGMLLYLIAVGAVSLAYVKHRNTRVLDFDRVLTTQHIKGLLAGEEKKLGGMKNFVFFTANRNEVPLPEPRTPEFFGYKTSYEILSDAIWRRADSIMFSPTAQGYSVTYHIDGAPLKQPGIAKEQMKYIVHFLKHLADLDTKEIRKPQRGKFRASKDKTNTEWEVTTAGSTAGEQIRLKLLTRENITRLADIGLMPDQYEQLSRFREIKQGLFITTGPKKSGVTTTFYALLRNHDAFLNSINTLERRPSVELPNITQNIYALSDTGTTTFAKKLQAMVRMGPDIVGVADCEDAETAQVACTSSKDGKLVYVTLEADSVIQALGKWLKLVGNITLAVDTLLGISNQRLLRKLCNECKQAYTPDKELLRKFNISAEKTKVLYRAGKVQYDKHSKPTTCEHCQGTGYVGRTGVFETVILNDELRNVVKQSKSLPEIGTQFRRAKTPYLQEQVLRKVISGVTSVNEMVRVLSPSKGKTTAPEDNGQ